MAKAAQNVELAAAVDKHIAETEAQVERLEKVFKESGEERRQDLSSSALSMKARRSWSPRDPLPSMPV
jgi:ferritin-like metal-binding protein YciE